MKIAVIYNLDQAVLVERYIEGKEINVGLLGNGENLETFPPAELVFGEGGPNIYTLEDKKHQSGREVRVVCPATVDEPIAKKATELTRKVKDPKHSVFAFLTERRDRLEKRVEVRRGHRIIASAPDHAGITPVIIWSRRGAVSAVTDYWWMVSHCASVRPSHRSDAGAVRKIG